MTADSDESSRGEGAEPSEGAATRPVSTPPPGAGAPQPNAPPAGNAPTPRTAASAGTGSPADAPAAGQPSPAGRPKPLSLQVKLAFGVVALVAAVALFWPRHPDAREAPGGFLLDPNGRPATLGERLAPVTLLHFWATWCPPCITEIPSLYRLGADAPGEFAILMVAVGDQASNVEEFLGDRAATALFDPNWEVAHRYGTYKLPETYVLVAGEPVDRYIGAQNWDDPALRRRLATTIREHGGKPPVFEAGR